MHHHQLHLKTWWMLLSNGWQHSWLRTLRLLEGLFSTSTLIGHLPQFYPVYVHRRVCMCTQGLILNCPKLSIFWAQVQFLGWAGREIPWIIRKNKYCGSYSEKILHILGIQCANLVLIVSSTDGVQPRNITEFMIIIGHLYHWNRTIS